MTTEIKLQQKKPPAAISRHAGIKYESQDLPVYGSQRFFCKEIPKWKRGMDIFGSILAIILFSPIMVVAAIAVKLDSKGGIIFRQKRAGLGEKPFYCYKFRSMYEDSDKMKEKLLTYNERTGPVFKMTDDPRITRVGRVIRKWSIDEMPQFFNVLKGDMSLVGPRPPIVDEVTQYRRWQGRRLEVKPGITCLWQIYERHNSSFENWVRLDIEYARNHSFMLDVKILLQTLPAVLSRRGAK